MHSTIYLRGMNRMVLPCGRELTEEEFVMIKLAYSKTGRYGSYGLVYYIC